MHSAASAGTQAAGDGSYAAVYQITGPRASANAGSGGLGGNEAGNGPAAGDWAALAAGSWGSQLGGASRVCVAIVLVKWGFFQVRVFPECTPLNGRHGAMRQVADLFYSACSGRRIDSVDQGQLGPGPGCVVAGGGLPGNVPGDVLDKSGGGYGGPGALLALGPYLKRAVATGMPVPVTMAGNSFVGMTIPRDIADTANYLRGTYGDSWNTTCMVCPHHFFSNWEVCQARAAKLSPASVRAAMVLIPACNS